MEEYFRYGGEALVLTLRDGLGEALTEEIKSAWVAVYDFIAANIISGLRFAREKAPGLCGGADWLQESLLKKLQPERRSSAPTAASGSATSFSSMLGQWFGGSVDDWG